MLQVFAWLSLGTAFICAAMITVHEIRHPQKMMVMNLVWPLTALYLSVFGLFAYFALEYRWRGREATMKGNGSLAAGA
jgi:heme/copper-type cytochrome/quinol oxidase subunit 2